MRVPRLSNLLQQTQQRLWTKDHWERKREQQRRKRAQQHVEKMTEQTQLKVQEGQSRLLREKMYPVTRLHDRRWDSSRWHPNLRIVLEKTAEQYRSIIVPSWQDLSRYELLQPTLASSRGASVRAKQWQEMGGEGGATGTSLLWPVAGAVACALIGAAVYLNPETRVVPIYVLAGGGALIGALLGYALARSQGAGFYVGQMLVVVNERASVVHPEQVTAQAEAWITKTLLHWRTADWRYRLGRPYLWLMLTEGERIMDHLNGSEDYITLDSDPYRSNDLAVYGQRNLNRMVSTNANTYKQYDDSIKDPPKSTWEAMMPKLTSVGIILVCVLLLLYGGD